MLLRDSQGATLGLRDVPTFVGCRQAEAGPNAVTYPGSDRGRDFDFVDGEASRLFDRFHNSLLAGEKTGKYFFEGAELDRLDGLGSFHSKSRGRFERPDKDESPEIETVGTCRDAILSFSLRELTIPYRKVRVGADIEVRHAFRDGPRSGITQWRLQFVQRTSGRLADG